MNPVLIKDTVRKQGWEDEEGAQALNANKKEETEKAQEQRRRQR